MYVHQLPADPIKEHGYEYTPAGLNSQCIVHNVIIVVILITGAAAAKALPRAIATGRVARRMPVQVPSLSAVVFPYGP
jgi:hypothetical protein